MPLSVESTSKKRVQVNIGGIVQGVGFRPYIYQEALKNNLTGYVSNNGSGVRIEIEGSLSRVEYFLNSFEQNAPELSRIDTISIKDIDPRDETTFSIVKTQNSKVLTMVSADISLCDDCRREMQDPKNRRYKYPFINCTNCGPRYTIIDSLPYDRKNTSMKDYVMCEACSEEYEDPSNRRYHAQPISCFDCGPQLHFSNLLDEESIQNKNFVKKLSQKIAAGETVALKGIGGFHIICDATNDKAVAQLRLNKHRATKPFAVMFRNLQEIKKIAKLSHEDEALILSKERPIVIVQKNRSKKLAQSIAPNIDKIGVFLPYTPLHELLLEELKLPIIATSANLSDEPIIRDNRELFVKLPLVVQASLSNNREILNACDDSVLMNVANESIVLRLSRGYAPKSFFLQEEVPKKILALGANQKSTISLAFGNNIVISPHIGDLNSLESFEYFLRTLDTFKRFYDFQPDIIVCDKHPKYETTVWAKEYASQHPHIQLFQVQHHYAHALACIAENQIDEEVLAFCFDGTGYGDDGVLWGSEVLLASKDHYERVYHLKEFSLLGGEKAVKEPRRVALSLLFDYYTLDAVLEMDTALVKSFTQKEIKTLYLMKIKAINSPKSTSMGRLFDAVYALSNHLDPLAYEGESGLIMESEANKYRTKRSYSFEIKDSVIEYHKMIAEILDEKDLSLVASKFINTIVKMILEISLLHKDKPIVLSGGVFQNKVLLEQVLSMCKENDIKYYIQRETPINDGGISLGQVYYGIHNQRGENDE